MMAPVMRTAALVGLVAALCAAAVIAAPSKSATAAVTIDNFSFSPAELKVAVGTTVTWTNRDDIPHTVVSTDKVFKSRVLDSEEKYSFTFTTAGSYAYFCSIHPKMTGRVIVQ